MEKKVQEIINIFKQISTIPRCSGNEENIAAWLERWAEKTNLTVRTDPVGNVVIKAPATEGYETIEGMVIQGHMDMVCEKTPESHHDFLKDPISIVSDGEWLKAEKTTLGADNGIGIALCLALAEDETIAHPTLELLFTVEEETGLRGAESLEPGFIEGKALINIDSEDEGVFTVGSAGGRVLIVEYPISTEPLPETYHLYILKISGLRGGHSGGDIHKHRGNANKILAGALKTIDNTFDVRLVSIKGGSLSNAIPRDAEAVIACDPARVSALQTAVSGFEQTVRGEYAASDPAVSIKLSEFDSDDSSMTALVQKDTKNLMALLTALPDGVVEMSSNIEGLVETSNNLATVELSGDMLTIQNFSRSSVMAKLDEVTSTIEDAAARVGAGVKTNGDFPPWEPNMHSPLLKQCREVYKSLYKKEPEVSVIHAGLECSVIGSKIPGLDMISMGPTIKNPHSPDEKLHIPSIGRVWEFLVSLLAGRHR